MIRDALAHRLSHEDTSLKYNSTDEEKEHLDIGQGRFLSVLVASVSLPDTLESDLRERELAQNIILAHHSAICMSSIIRKQMRPQLSNTGGTSRSTWIEACQRAGVDPHHLISERTDELMKLIWENVDMTKTVCIYPVCLNWLLIYLSQAGILCECGLSSCYDFDIRCPGFHLTATYGAATP